MSELKRQAEQKKLMAVLGASEDKLAFLAGSSPETLRALRVSISASLFDRHVKSFKKLAEASKLLPNKMLAAITEKAIGPTLAAQIAGLLPTADAVDLSSRLSTPFLADICLALDPRRAGPMLQAMPVTTVVDVAMLLLARREFITMARFVDELTDDQIQAVAAKMPGEGMLQIGFYVETPQRLNDLIQLLSLEQLQSTIQAACAKDGALWPQAMSLMADLEMPQRERLANLLADADPQTLDTLNKALFEKNLWREALPMFEALNDAAQETLVSAFISHAGENGEAILRQLMAEVDDSLASKINLALAD